MILVIDDDEAVTASLSLLLKQSGYASATAATPTEAIARIERDDVALVIQDMNFTRKTTGEEGLELLARIRRRAPDLPVILMTAWGSIELAVEGLKAGARDFITKPWTNGQILHAVGTALGVPGDPRAPSGEASGRRPTRADLAERYDLTGVTGESRTLVNAIDIAGRVAATDASILITGESGTGKEVLAEFVHQNSPRKERPLVRVNLGGVSSSLFDSELFGHVKGAFTDARTDRAGRFAEAEGGTILLDEIGELDPSGQVKMLRVLQDRAYTPLGSDRVRPMDVRVISATNRNLEEDIRSGRFREDLFYRLNLITVHLPALAERGDDLALLARHFVQTTRRTYGFPELTLDESAIRWLGTRRWPGNVRQLRHVIERAALIADSRHLTVQDFARAFDRTSERDAEDWVPPVGTMTVEEVEKTMILKSIAHHDGNLSRVAESLGLSRGALYRRLEKFGIEH